MKDLNALVSIPILTETPIATIQSDRVTTPYFKGDGFYYLKDGVEYPLVPTGTGINETTESSAFNARIKALEDWAQGISANEGNFQEILSFKGNIFESTDIALNLIVGAWTPNQTGTWFIQFFGNTWTRSGHVDIDVLYEILDENDVVIGSAISYSHISTPEEQIPLTPASAIVNLETKEYKLRVGPANAGSQVRINRYSNFKIIGICLTEVTIPTYTPPQNNGVVGADTPLINYVQFLPADAVDGAFYALDSVATGGLFYRQSGQWKRMNPFPAPPIAPPQNRALTARSDGTLSWEIAESAGTLINYSLTLPDSGVEGSYQAVREQGLFYRLLGNWEPVNTPGIVYTNNLPSNAAIGAFYAKDDGLFRFDGTEWTRISTYPGFPWTQKEKSVMTATMTGDIIWEPVSESYNPYPDPPTSTESRALIVNPDGSYSWEVLANPALPTITTTEPRIFTINPDGSYSWELFPELLDSVDTTNNSNTTTKPLRLEPLFNEVKLLKELELLRQRIEVLEAYQPDRTIVNAPPPPATTSSISILPVLDRPALYELNLDSTPADFWTLKGAVDEPVAQGLWSWDELSQTFTVRRTLPTISYPLITKKQLEREGHYHFYTYSPGTGRPRFSLRTIGDKIDVTGGGVTYSNVKIILSSSIDPVLHNYRTGFGDSGSIDKSLDPSLTHEVWVGIRKGKYFVRVDNVEVSYSDLTPEYPLHLHLDGDLGVELREIEMFSGTLPDLPLGSVDDQIVAARDNSYTLSLFALSDTESRWQAIADDSRATDRQKAIAQEMAAYFGVYIKDKFTELETARENSDPQVLLLEHNLTAAQTRYTAWINENDLTLKFSHYLIPQSLYRYPDPVDDPTLPGGKDFTDSSIPYLEDAAAITIANSLESKIASQGLAVARTYVGLGDPVPNQTQIDDAIALFDEWQGAFQDAPTEDITPINDWTP